MSDQRSWWLSVAAVIVTVAQPSGAEGSGTSPTREPRNGIVRVERGHTGGDHYAFNSLNVVTSPKPMLTEQTVSRSRGDTVSDRAADLAFVNAAAHTVDPRRPKAQALSIRDGLIHAVGRFDDVAPTIGTATDVVDLDGRTLLPGFQDAHNHPPIGGLDRMRCNLESAATPDETLALVAAYAVDRRDETWIRGGAWTFSAFRGDLPTAQQLDAVTGDRPAYLTEAGSHGAWVNSAALRLAGIEAARPTLRMVASSAMRAGSPPESCTKAPQLWLRGTRRTVLRRHRLGTAAGPAALLVARHHRVAGRLCR